MNNQKMASKLACTWLAALPLFMAMASTTLAQVAPSQNPLLTKVGAGVPPNVILTLDDSGSMQFQHIPENVFAGGTYATTNPVGSDTVRWDPSDNYMTGFLVGTVPGNINSTNYVLRALRSPDTNSLFYNPEIRYRPWLTSDGVTRLPDSPVAKAYINPLIRTGASGTYTDLTTYTAPSGSSNWCYSGSSTAAPGSGGCNSVNNNSSSLNHDPGVYFRLQTTSGVYKSVTSSSNYTGYSINAVASTTFTKYPKRDDCVAVAGVCTRTEERQNYANWYSYYRTRNLMARGSMMEAFGTADNKFRLGFGRINKGSGTVDGVSTTVLESSSTYGGGGVRPFDATRKAQLFKWLEDLPASGGTPLPSALNAVGTYYTRTDARGPWTDDPSVSTNVVADNKTCRRAYNIMTTDGYWNGTPPTVGNQDATAGNTITGTGVSYAYTPTTPYSDGTSNTLADVAMKYWKTDLQPAMANNVPPVGDNHSFWQNMTNYTVGLGVRGTLDPATDLAALVAGTKTWPAATTSTTAPNIDDLWHAALNTRGAYYSAKDPQELASAIKGALAGALGGAGTTAGVATASTVLENTNRKYVPTYIAGEWSGDIGAQPLDANGQAGTTVWYAAQRMPAWNLRNIVTWDTGLATPAAVPFKWSSLSVANQAALGSVAATYTTQFIDFLWGDHSQEGLAKPFRQRLDGAGKPFILGDFVNSNPVLIKGSFDGGYAGLSLGGASAYQNFLNTKAARDATLFAGGNDGMLHAFKDTKGATAASTLTDGQEVFAYVPRTVYANLNKLTDKNYGTSSLGHQFFVDGPQRESDAFVKAPGATAASWRNYLTGSLGAGGRAVYALDVTDAPNLNASSVRWEISSDSDSDLGYVMSPIEVGVLPNGKWVAIFGNGFSSTNGYAALFVVNLETAAINKLVVDATGNNGLGGVAVQRDANGVITNLYAGDLKGKLWKLDYAAAATSNFSVSGGSAFFTATDSGAAPQPITSTPAVFDHSQGGKVVVFGTGKLFSSTDGTDVSPQTVYGVWDKPADAMTRPLGRSVLAPRTLSAVQGTGAAASTTYYNLTGTPVDWTTQRGWYIDLDAAIPGGRVIYPAQSISFELALVSVVAPPQSVAVCDSGSGVGIDLTLLVEDGANPPYHLFDTNGDGQFNSSDAYVTGYKTNADGIDSIVNSAAKNSTDGSADGPCPPGFYRVSIQNTTGQMMTCVRRPPCTNCTPTRTFDRVWRRIINPPLR